MKDTFLSRFTPSLMSHATLEAIFVQREKLAKALVERVRDSALTPAKHHTLLIGPRGIGKTHLVALVYHRVKALEEVQDRLRIAWLREEEWGITSFMDLLLRILRALAEEHADAALGEKIEAIYARSSREEAERAAAELLTAYVGDRTLLILVENLDDVFGGLGEEGQQQLRAYLQNHPFSTLLATAQSLFGGVSVKTSPFYGFFNVHHLNAFSLDEAVQLLATIARLEGDGELADFIQTPKGRARIRAVHHLAGGNPRIYVILSQFLTRTTLDELVEPFMSMLDDMTPYYQARMQWLSPQQRKIVEFLIERRHAVPVKDIAGRAFATHQTISSQLRTLREMGYVRSIPVGRESRYELREPLMRMCVEVKKHRGKPIRLFVDFLRLWYTQAELEQRLKHFALGDGFEREYVLQALQTDNEPSEPPLLESCWGDYRTYYEAGDFGQALNAAEEMVAIRGTAVDWCNQGIALEELGHHQKALASLDKAVELLRPGDAKVSWHTWYNRGIALMRLDRHEEALASYEKAAESWPENVNAEAPYARSVVLGNLGRHEEALTSYEETISLQPEDARAWHNRGVALANLERHEEALASYDKAVELEPENGLAWYNRGLALNELGRHEEALASSEKAVGLQPEDARMWFSQGVALADLKRYEEALASYDQAVELEPDFVSALLSRSYALALLDRWEESFVTLDETLSDFGGTGEVQLVTLGKDFTRFLFASSPSAEAKKDCVSTLVAIYEKHNALPALAVGLQRSLGGSKSIEDAALSEWQEAWQAAASDHDAFQLPLRLLDAVIQYRATQDPRVLLDLPLEERDLLRQLLEIEDFEEAQRGGVSGSVFVLL